VIATTPAGAGVVQSHTRTGESVQLDPIANGVYDTLVSVRESVGVTAAGDRPLEFTAGRPIDL
ncbi:hypothetical protein, partial [Botrimarina sp.]|uniref:hypothetical protein n=1 Tax=Botrimarina sp. TaxID=2795802 RepID=UPI0032EC5791